MPASLRSHKTNASIRTTNTTRGARIAFYLPDARKIWAHFVDLLKFGPLVAATWAPVSTLLDIPALTQPWWLFNGEEAPDFRTSLILSGFSLAFNIIANLLLVLRFTVSDRWWKPATFASVVAWVVKLVVALVNLCVYGDQRRNDPGYTYTEGFWCAVLSLIIAGLITIVLVFHWACRFDEPSHSGAEMRVIGAQFILSDMAFVLVIALQGLIFSKIESWSFFTGVYFSIVTSLTIGYGDFSPTTTATRVLLFPFAVTTIALLGVILNNLVNFVAERAEERKQRWRERFEEKYSQFGVEDEAANRSLAMELLRIKKMEAAEGRFVKVFDLISAVVSMVTFWIIGAVIFSAIEGWAFGTSMYYCYVTFLTIGYGDLSPSTSAGQVFFIVWVFLAVPVVSNFVVATVSGTISAFAEQAAQNAKDKRAPIKSEQKLFHHHAYNVEQAHGKIDKHVDEICRLPHALEHARSNEGTVVKRIGMSKDEEDQETQTEGAETKRARELVLARLVLELAIQLESKARIMLVQTLDPDSKARKLLKADANLQRRVLDTVVTQQRNDELAENGETSIRSRRMSRGSMRSNNHDCLLANTAFLEPLDGDDDKAVREMEEERREEAARKEAKSKAKARRRAAKQKASLKIRRTASFARSVRSVHSATGANGNGESSGWEDDHAIDDDEAEDSDFSRPFEQLDKLEQVRQYRETFAGLLAAGSKLMRMQGLERLAFERRLENDHELDFGGMLLGTGRKGPAERVLGIDV